MQTIAPSFVHVPNFVTPQQYATLCGINTASVYHRHRRGLLAGIVISGKLFIDVETTPPAPPYTVRFHKAPPPRLPIGLPPADRLVCLDTWAFKQNITANRFYSAILFGRLPAWGFGDQVVVELTSALLQV